MLSRLRAGETTTDRVVGALAAFSFVGGTVELLLTSDVPHRAVGIAAIALLCVAFAASPRHPVPAVLTVSAVFMLQALIGAHIANYSGFMLIPLVGTLFTWGLRTTDREFWLSAGPTLAGVMVAIAVDAGDADDEVVANVIWVTVVFLGGPLVSARVLRWRMQVNRRLEEQAQELERNREARVRAARLATRTTIANELHDLIAHEVSVMVVQAQAARRGVERGREDAASSIESIEITGREALTEMRRLLGVLRHDEDGLALAPQPTLRRLDGLVTRARNLGVQARMDRSEVSDEIPSSVDVTAYRIAQEALRSAVEHGHATRVDGRFATRDGVLEMDLDSDGLIAPAALAGLRERAEMFGGGVEVRTHGAGGMLLVRIPLDGASAEVPA